MHCTKQTQTTAKPHKDLEHGRLSFENHDHQVGKLYKELAPSVSTLTPHSF